MNNDQQDPQITLADTAGSQITEAINSTLDLVTGKSGTDEERDQLTADACYEALRADIGEAIQAAIESAMDGTGKVLVQEKTKEVEGSHGAMYTNGIIEYGHWHSSLPPAAQPHYNCNHCRQAWPQLTGLGVLSPDGSISYPLVAAFIKNSENPIIQHMFDSYPEIRQAIETKDTRKANYLPVAKLNNFFVNQITGGFQHFHGGNKEVIAKYNAAHTVFIDIEYVNILFKKLTSPELNPTMLSKVFAYVKAQIGDKEHTALSRSDALVNIITILQDMKKTSRNAYVYLLALLQNNDYAWMKHAYGSVLGIVLDAMIEFKDSDDVEAILGNIKQNMSSATSLSNYKNKTAEAPAASVDQAFMFLKENDLTAVFNRRLLPLSEAKSMIWNRAGVEPTNPVEAPAPSPVELAYQELKKEKNPQVEVLEKLETVLNNAVVNVRMSVVEFINQLPITAKIDISYKTKVGLIPIFVTAATEEADHDELLSFDKTIHDTASVLRTVNGMAFQTAMHLSASHDDSEYVSNKPKGIVVDAILVSNRSYNEGDVPNYILNVPQFGYNFHSTFEGTQGACITGTAIKSKHLGMSRALMELARKIPLNTDAGMTAAGGIFLQLGMVFNVLYKDGTRKDIELSSVK